MRMVFVSRAAGSQGLSFAGSADTNGIAPGSTFRIIGVKFLHISGSPRERRTGRRRRGRPLGIGSPQETKTNAATRQVAVRTSRNEPARRARALMVPVPAGSASALLALALEWSLPWLGSCACIRASWYGGGAVAGRPIPWLFWVHWVHGIAAHIARCFTTPAFTPHQGGRLTPTRRLFYVASSGPRVSTI